MVDYFVRSPRQATTIYGLDGNSAPRSRSQFYVRFRRTSNGQASSGWQDNLGFMVKSLDRPSVQPQLDEVNQYNKKRWITTGFKLQPMRIVLYDTADSLVMRMWDEYSRWYFGDFNQDDETQFRYDVTTADFLGDDIGFGFVPRPSAASTDGKDSSLDLNSQFFFDAIEVYQVFGGEFTQFDLINPKIGTFDPDELDYSASEPATISMTLNFEAIIYRNGGAPTPISSNSDIAAVFDEDFDGDTFDVTGAAVRHNLSTMSPSLIPFGVDDFRRDPISEATGLLDNSGNTIGGGALGQFGNLDFGSLRAAVRAGKGIAGDVSYLASGNIGLSTLLNLPVGGSSSTINDLQSRLGLPQQSPRAILGSTLDAATGALKGRGGGSEFGDDYIDDNLVGGVAASASIDDSSIGDQLTPTGQSGLLLNSQSYGVINAQRPSYSQIGYNDSYSTSYSSNSSDDSLSISTDSDPIDI
jgi:hypothetical protein